MVVEGVRQAQQEHQNDRYDYNVLTDAYEDLVAAGSVDPIKVVLLFRAKCGQFCVADTHNGHPDYRSTSKTTYTPNRIKEESVYVCC